MYVGDSWINVSFIYFNYCYFPESFLFLRVNFISEYYAELNTVFGILNFDTFRFPDKCGFLELDTQSDTKCYLLFCWCVSMIRKWRNSPDGPCLSLNVDGCSRRELHLTHPKIPSFYQTKIHNQVNEILQFFAWISGLMLYHYLNFLKYIFSSMLRQACFTTVLCNYVKMKILFWFQ